MSMCEGNPRWRNSTEEEHRHGRGLTGLIKKPPTAKEKWSDLFWFFAYTHWFFPPTNYI
jgi:hypothetical protein